MTMPPPAFVIPAAVPAPAPAVPPPAPGPAPAQTPMTTLDALVDKYRRLRDRKKEIAERHRGELAPFNEALDQLGAMLLDALNRAGAESTRTKSGTVFKSTRSSYTVKDPAQFREWLEQNHRFDLLETRVSKDSIEEFLKTAGQLPPGIGISSEITVNVRK